MPNKVKLLSWSFPDVWVTLRELARKGGMSTDREFLRKQVHTLSAQFLDQVIRDPNELGRLTPPLEIIADMGNEYGVGKSVLGPLLADATAAQRLTKSTVEPVRYGTLSMRHEAMKLMFGLACHIQGDPLDPKDLDKRTRHAAEFSNRFYGWGWDDPHPALQQELAKHELLFGQLFATRGMAIAARYPNLDIRAVVEKGLKKYGRKDIRGLSVCTWSNSAPCLDPGRKGAVAAKRLDVTETDIWTMGVPEMDRFMWEIYGPRNDAFDALMGLIRSFIEDQGELGWLFDAEDYGGNEGIAEKMGCFHIPGRHYEMLEKKLKAGVPLWEAIMDEIADAWVSWPCLGTHALGLNFLRSLLRFLKYAAARANVELEVPKDMTRTAPELTSVYRH